MKMPTRLWAKKVKFCLLYTSDAADERSSVDLGGRRIIKKKKNNITRSEVGPKINTTQDERQMRKNKEEWEQKKYIMIA